MKENVFRVFQHMKETLVLPRRRRGLVVSSPATELCVVRSNPTGVQGPMLGFFEILSQKFLAKILAFFA
jgi:hypothetical protein